MSSEDCSNTKAFFSPLKAGIEELNCIISMFKKLKKTYGKFLKSLNKVHANLILKVESPITSISNALVNVKTHLNFWIKQLSGFVDHLQFDIIEPLLLFFEHLQTEFSELSIEADNISDSLFKTQKRLIACKEVYIKDEEILENLYRTLVSESNQEDLTKQRDLYQNKVSDDIQDCLAAEEISNHSYDYYKIELPALIEKIKFTEESRIYFLKTTFEKFTHYSSLMDKELLNSNAELTKITSAVNSRFDIDSIYSNIELILPEKINFETYQMWKAKRSIDEVHDNEIVNSVLDLLIFQKKGNHADFNRLSNIIGTAQGKEWLVQGLEARKSQCKLEMQDLEKLSAILNDVFYDIGFTDQSNIIFSKIIQLADVFYTELDNKKIYLWSFLAKEAVLHDDSRWLFAIDNAISEEVKIQCIASGKLRKKDKSKSLLTSLKDFAKNIGSGQDKKKREMIEKKVAINILYDFSVRMRKFAISPSISKSVILTFGVKHAISPEDLQILLAIIRAPQELDKKKLSRSFSLTVFLPFQMALPFLTARESVTLLFLKKSCTEIMQNQIVAKCLLEWKGNLSLIRPTLWRKLLHSFFPDEDYYKSYNVMKSDKKSISGISYIIKMDVTRSYQNKKHSHNALKHILKTYAYLFPNVSYCQGMNFIAGTLYFLMNDEKLAFDCLAAIIKKNDMEKIFGLELWGLKCMFYKLDKLIELLLPEIYYVFISRGIFASSFSSSFFLTLFSSTIDHLEILYVIWDYFIAKGWKAIFKAAIYVLQYNTKQITNGSYEDNLKLLNGGGLFTGEVFSGLFLEEVRKIKITSSILLQLERDYDEIVEDCNLSKE